jgi:hypothetical protein
MQVLRLHFVSLRMTVFDRTSFAYAMTVCGFAWMTVFGFTQDDGLWFVQDDEAVISCERNRMECERRGLQSSKVTLDG